jgi:hypothetical protein
MRVAHGRTRTLHLDGGGEEGWQVAQLLERIEALETKNGSLRAKLHEARHRTDQLECQNRHLRETLLRIASDADD